MKKFCWITWMGSNCHTLCPYKRQAKGDQTDRSREKCGDKTDTETGMMWPQGREPGSPQKLQETKNRFSLLCYCLLFAYPLCPNQFIHLTAIFQILHLLISSTFPNFLFHSLPCYLLSSGPLTKYFLTNSKLYFPYYLCLKKTVSLLLSNKTLQMQILRLQCQNDSSLTGKENFRSR